MDASPNVAPLSRILGRASSQTDGLGVGKRATPIRIFENPSTNSSTKRHRKAQVATLGDAQFATGDVSIYSCNA